MRRSRLSKPSFALLLVVTLFVLKRCSEVPIDLVRLYELLREKSPEALAGCQLPKLDPWDHSILQYVQVPTEGLKCKSLQPQLTFLDNEGFLVLDEKAKQSSGYKSITCQYRTFFHNDGVDDDSLRFGQWQVLENKAKIDADYVHVECREGMLNRRIYTYHWPVITKPVSNKFLPNSPEQPSVLLFGLDSMSQGNFIRQLPLTYKFLKDSMKATIFDGHVKVGDNTYINLLAVLTGKRSGNTKEFKNELHDKWYMFYDNWTDFMWDKYWRRGYATLFAEDRPDINVFNYMGYLYGFKYSPTSHYFRPFWLAVHGNFLHRRSSAFCYDTVPEHKLQLDWLERYVKVYKGTRSFALYWSQNLSHEFLNTIGVADQDFHDFFAKNLEQFENTIVIVWSDHGHRYASIRESVIGRLEARMPFLAIYIPPAIQKKYPNLKSQLDINSQRLTTQFDLHSTLLDILSSNFGPDANQYDSRAHSLFRPVPANRQCPEAHIPEEFCPCYQEMPIPTDGPFALQAAEALMDNLHSLLAPAGSKCARLSLSQIKNAWIFLPHSATMQDPQVGGRIPLRGFHVNYRVVIEVLPNMAVIEAVIKHSLDSGTFALAGDVERNNKYGNTSQCVSDRELRKICYCV